VNWASIYSRKRRGWVTPTISNKGTGEDVETFKTEAPGVLLLNGSKIGHTLLLVRVATRNTPLLFETFLLVLTDRKVLKGGKESGGTSCDFHDLYRKNDQMSNHFSRVSISKLLIETFKK